MMKTLLTVAITIVCLYNQITGASITYSNSSFLSEFFLYQFSHANWWHLGANVLCLWTFRPRVSTTIIAYMISVWSAMLDLQMFGVETCGMSAMICAAIARRTVAWGENYMMMLSVLMLGAILPGVNWHVHVIAYTLGVITWAAYYIINLQLKSNLDWKSQIKSLIVGDEIKRRRE